MTGPVSKALIARSGAPGAERFTGHTEWLQARDGAKSSVMCFASPRLTTSLASTHLPLHRVPEWLTPSARGRRPATSSGSFSCCSGQTLRASRSARSTRTPARVSCSATRSACAILPGIRLARRRLRGKVELLGPIGAESAYRLAYAGKYDGVVAMYHDQATIPTKLVAFGDAVNVTLGLSRVRTSVDHGTAYDIAWQGKADAGGMVAALKLAQRLIQPASA